MNTLVLILIAISFVLVLICIALHRDINKLLQTIKEIKNELNELNTPKNVSAEQNPLPKAWRVLEEFNNQKIQ